jgi:hypothetical protein
MAQNTVVNAEMTLEEMVETQVRFAQEEMGQFWTRQQALNALFFLGWLTGEQWETARWG